MSAVRIAVLLFFGTTVAKLAGHAFTREEVRQVSDGDRIVIRASPLISVLERDRDRTIYDAVGSLARADSAAAVRVQARPVR